MKIGDVVVFRRCGMPVVGEVVGFTPKRTRLAVRNGGGYISVLRSARNIRVERKARLMA